MQAVYAQAVGPSREQREHDYILRAENAYIEVYNLMLSDPKRMASDLYRSQPGKTELSGSLLSLDDGNICCLVDKTVKGEIRPEDAVVASTATPDSICDTDIRKLNIGGKLAKPLLAIYDDQRMVIKVSKVEPRIRWMPVQDYSVIRELLTSGQLSSDEMTTFQCWNPRADFLIAGDNFTTDILVGRLIASIYADQSAPGRTFNDYWAAALCQKDTGWFRRSLTTTGLIMMEYADFGPVNKLINNRKLFASLSANYRVPGGLEVATITWNQRTYRDRRVFPADFARHVMLQIAAAYDYLYQTHQFTHGDAKVSNLLVSSHESNFNYRGVTINCPVTVKITDFSKSSISILTADDKVTRIFNYDRVAEAQLKIAKFQPKLRIVDNRRVYRLRGVLEIVKLSKIRHGGLPFFRSFDIYTAFTSILMLPEFLIPVLQNDDLRRDLWSKLWLPEDMQKMERRLMNAAFDKVEPTYSNVLSILDDVYLYCDLADTLFPNKL